MAKPEKELNFTVLIEQDEDGLYVAKVPDIPGCYTQGRTIEQAMERVKEAIQACIESEDEAGVRPLKFIGIQQLQSRHDPASSNTRKKAVQNT